MSHENLSPGNCVAATVFPQEIMSLTINVATVYPKEILSSGNTVARHGLRHILPLAFCCNQTYIILFVIRTKGTLFEEEQNDFCRKVLHDNEGGVKLRVLRNILR